MTDDQRAFAITAALGFIEMVWQSERAINPNSARATRLSRGIDQLVKLTDIYNPSAMGWPKEKLDLACALVDEMNERIQEVFNDGIEGGGTGAPLCGLRKTDPVPEGVRSAEP